MKKVINRMKEPTPKFFRTLRNTGMALTAVAAVLATAPVAIPTGIITAMGYLGVAGAVVTAVSQAAVYRDE